MTIAPLLIDLQMIKVFPAWLVDAAIGDIKFAQGQPASKIGSMFALQGGIHLADIQSTAIMKMIEQLQDIIGLPCDPVRCSARLQRPNGQFELRWHQDYAPMDLVLQPAHVKARVVWVPLMPLDGKRPSLEVSEPMLPQNHVEDERKFLYAPELQDIGLVGTIITNEPAGSCWAFSPYAPHRTHVTPTMTLDRISLDLRFCEAW